MSVMNQSVQKIEMCENLVEISTLADINLSTVVVLWIIAHNIWYCQELYGEYEK